MHGRKHRRKDVGGRTHTLHQKLAGDGVYVGEIVVLGQVKGTAYDSGTATLEPGAIAEKFWELYQTRAETSVNFE
jgi:hypothetical protein